MRTIETRLTEYSEGLRSTAQQLEDLVGSIERQRMDVNPETQGLRDTIKLHRLVADDLDKILAGVELSAWMVTGTLEVQLTDAQQKADQRCRDCREGKHGACTETALIEDGNDVLEVDCICASQGHPQ